MDLKSGGCLEGVLGREMLQTYPTQLRTFGAEQDGRAGVVVVWAVPWLVASATGSLYSASNGTSLMPALIKVLS